MRVLRNLAVHFHQIMLCDLVVSCHRTNATIIWCCTEQDRETRVLEVLNQEEQVHPLYQVMINVMTLILRFSDASSKKILIWIQNHSSFKLSNFYMTSINRNYVTKYFCYITDVERLSQEISHASIAPKFIRDTTAYWYKRDITRDQVILTFQIIGV